MSNFDVNRREFVVGGLVAGVLPLGAYAGAKEARAFGTGAPRRLHKLLVDRSIPESARLGTYAGFIADEALFFDGDFTALWIRELKTQWADGPKPIAGLTRPGVRMVLEQFGRDHGARIVFSAEHRRLGGTMRHKLMGCDTLLQSTDLRGAADWVADMARHIAACPYERGLKAASLVYETSDPAKSLHSHSTLETWVMASTSRNDQRFNSETVNS